MSQRINLKPGDPWMQTDRGLMLATHEGSRFLKWPILVFTGVYPSDRKAWNASGPWPNIHDWMDTRGIPGSKQEMVDPGLR